jgi:hypothetical protein
MKRMAKTEIKSRAKSTYDSFVSTYGARNAKDILFEAYKLVRAELNRRKKL